MTRPFIRGILIKTVKKREDVEGAVRLWSYLVWFLAILIILIGISGNIAAAGISLGIFGAGVAFVNMKVRFLCDARKRAEIKSDIVWKILEKFNAPENKDKVEIQGFPRN